jgi:hypothetical protein
VTGLPTTLDADCSSLDTDIAGLFAEIANLHALIAMPVARHVHGSVG